MRKGQEKIFKKAKESYLPKEYMQLLINESYTIPFYDFAYRCMLHEHDIDSTIEFIKEVWEKYKNSDTALFTLRIIYKKFPQLAYRFLRNDAFEHALSEWFLASSIYRLLQASILEQDLQRIINCWAEYDYEYSAIKSLTDICIEELSLNGNIRETLLYASNIITQRSIGKEELIANPFVYDVKDVIYEDNENFAENVKQFLKHRIPYEAAKTHNFNYRKFCEEKKKKNLGFLADIYREDKEYFCVDKDAEEVLNTIYDMEIKAVVDKKCYFATCNSSDNGINLSFYTYSKVTVNTHDNLKKFSCAGGSVKLKLFISNDGGIIQELQLRNTVKYIPVRIKVLADYYKTNNPYFNEFIDNLEKYADEKEFYLFKDIVKYIRNSLFLPPITLNEVMQHHNMQELMGKYPSLLNYNKHNVNILYLTYKISRYVKDDSVNKILQYNDASIITRAGISNYTSFKRNWVIAKKFFIQYFMDNIPNEEFIRYYKKIHSLENLEVDENILETAKNEARIIISDYIDICIAEKEKINIKFKSIKKMSDKHLKISENALMKSYNKKSKPISIPKNSTFLKLREMLPEEFEWIKNKKRLNQESVMQHHCVWQYGEKISKDKCAIYSFVFAPEEKRYTIEFYFKKGKFYIRQMQSAYDRGYSNEAYEYVFKFIS